MQNFQDLQDEIPIGLCKQMCPPIEYHEREQQKRLSVFEVPSGLYRNTPIKEFSRSAAGKEVNLEELRPANVLIDTIDYLIDEIVDRKDQPWSVVYEFVFDRIRAVRQDLVVQRLLGDESVMILEKAVRFHIFADYKLRDASIESFDPSLNDTHLQECLKRLLVLYDNDVKSQNRPEFEAYYLLHNLGSNEALERVLKLPDHIKENGFVKMSLDLSLMKSLGNFVAIFRLAAKLPYLGRCLIAKHAASLRCNAVKIMNTAFSIANCKFPLALFANVLAFESEVAAKEFVQSFGIEVDGCNIKFSKKAFIESTPQSGDCIFVADDAELPYSLRELLHGNTQAESPASISDSSTKKTSLSSTPLRVTVANNYCRPTVPEPHEGLRGVKKCDTSEMNDIQPVKGRGRGRGRGRARNINN